MTVKTPDPDPDFVDLTGSGTVVVVTPTSSVPASVTTDHPAAVVTHKDADRDPNIPPEISQVVYPTIEDGKEVSATTLMTRQLKAYHNRLGKTIKLYKGGGRRSVWRCSDYVNKERACARSGTKPVSNHSDTWYLCPSVFLHGVSTQVPSAFQTKHGMSSCCDIGFKQEV